ncbi:MAG TPA: type I methionyl aminopeptidase [Longimicrobium sp.]|nr:type I methionyl aminopeptidase [Longimicrobium sp.]
MSIESENDWRGLRAAGRVARLVLAEMAKQVRPGTTTAELDAVAARVLAEHGARHAPRRLLGFPADSCISVNDEAVHGLPGARVVQAGDLVKLDVVAEKDGYMADAAVTVAVPPVTEEKRRLVQCVRSAFVRAMKVARAGTRLAEIGRAVEGEARRCGFTVMRELGGHGIGRTMHEPPHVLNYHDPGERQVLTEGLVITVEPIIAARSGRAVQAADGWTLRTADGGLAAHHEHTIVITRGSPVLLTAA